MDRRIIVESGAIAEIASASIGLSLACRVNAPDPRRINIGGLESVRTIAA
jgi:hypothetical protein